jgi:hypothetical protein
MSPFRTSQAPRDSRAEAQEAGGRLVNSAILASRRLACGRRRLVVCWRRARFVVQLGPARCYLAREESPQAVEWIGGGEGPGRRRVLRSSKQISTRQKLYPCAHDVARSRLRCLRMVPIVRRLELFATDAEPSLAFEHRLQLFGPALGFPCVIEPAEH